MPIVLHQKLCRGPDGVGVNMAILYHTAPVGLHVKNYFAFLKEDGSVGPQKTFFAKDFEGYLEKMEDTVKI